MRLIIFVRVGRQSFLKAPADERDPSKSIRDAFPHDTFVDTHGDEAQAFQGCIARGVPFLIVKRTVQLDDHLRGVAKKIGDEPINRRLTPKLPSPQLLAAKRLPKRTLSDSAVGSKRARKRRLLPGAHHPNASLNRPLREKPRGATRPALARLPTCSFHSGTARMRPALSIQFKPSTAANIVASRRPPF